LRAIATLYDHEPMSKRAARSSRTLLHPLSVRLFGYSLDNTGMQHRIQT
jgi:hypothetical protein